MRRNPSGLLPEQPDVGFAEVCRVAASSVSRTRDWLNTDRLTILRQNADVASASFACPHASQSFRKISIVCNCSYRSSLSIKANLLG